MKPSHRTTPFYLISNNLFLKKSTNFIRSMKSHSKLALCYITCKVYTVSPDNKMQKINLIRLFATPAPRALNSLTATRNMRSVFTQIFNLPGLSLATRPLEKSLGVGEVRLSLFAASRLLQYSHLFCWSSWSQYVIS